MYVYPTIGPDKFFFFLGVAWYMYSCKIMLSFFFFVLAGSFRRSIFVAPDALKVTDQLEFWKEGAKKKDLPESHPAVSHRRACQL